ncbi:MAG: hypothetical protein KAJ42_17510 [Gemmatimonadetes bacterium]|nr:hypothetical protein [Gemmatimonadota bacterium]
MNPNALNGETFTYDDGGPNEKTWTFQTVLTDVDGNILIAATRELTHDNMIAAINLDPAGAGSQYAASMTAPVGIFAQSQGGFTALVTFIERGIVGNSIVLSDTMVTGWGSPTLDFGMEGVEAFVPIIQWGGIRIRVQQTGEFGELKAQFVRPARDRAPLGQPPAVVDPQADDKAFFYTLGQPAIDATFLGNGTEVSVEITASEHQGENWLKVSVSTRRPDLSVLDFCDISGVLLDL